jgi:DNA-binding NarL/FixJ family response regulator
MFASLTKLWKQKDLSAFDTNISRERLIQNGRIVVIDDEKPLLIEDLSRIGFSVDYDATGNDAQKLDSQLYDVAIVDFHGVGRKYGTNQGLDLLRHIRRVSPRTRLIAYTSRSLSASESEFFTLSHVVLPKDLGLEESMTIIEEQLRLAFSKQHLFESLIAKLSITDEDARNRVLTELKKSLSSRNEGAFKSFLKSFGSQAAEKGAGYLLDRLFDK